MEIRLLRSFTVLARYLSYREAAEALGLSQPALSKHIQALEADLGGPLFHRGRHGAELTPLGRFLHAQAQQLVADADQLQESGRRMAAGRIGRLALGFGLSTQEVAPRLLSLFRERYPDVELTLEDMPTSVQLNLLRSGELDIGFVRLPVGHEFEHLEVIDDQLALALPVDASWARGKAGLTALHDAPFVQLAHHRGAGLVDQITRYCTAREFTPQIIQRAGDIQTVLSLVAAGIGAAIVPATAHRIAGPGVRLIPLSGRSAHWQVGAAWLAGNDSPLVRNFVALAQAFTAPATESTL
ncbi:LysR family transcriptional regulator [Chitinolyticbacter meiyuanensis]|uniref:LysR family transcriptional regulator n=1 Tax=Chitinolyticbacter meiyuanensis TaxID=682798 RepID=UPI0011E5F685|nr:LysR family transcriptional regulator [Chitinolyticbacter meiyuanensis]